jgi:hypothetical protein
MENRTKHKILATSALYLMWITLGNFGLLPSFFHDSEIGRSHSLFNPLSILLDLALYVFLTYVAVAVIFGVMDQISGKGR